METAELQISLKNDEAQEGKHFPGTIRLKLIFHTVFSMCVPGEQQHCEEAKAVDIEAFQKHNKNKKLAKMYDVFLASESVIKQPP